MKYKNNKLVKTGDIININFLGKVHEVCVRKVILPDTQDALDWSASQGGILIESEQIGLILCRIIDEDIVFVKRGN